MTKLVLLPGMMCDGRLFEPQIKGLSNQCDVDVLPITEFESIAQIADDVLLKAPAKFSLAGLSMGGIVAMEIMAKAPDRVERLALLDTNPLAEDPAISNNRLRQIERVLNGELLSVMRDEMKPLYLTDGANRKAHLALCMDMALTLGPEVFVRQSKALMSRLDQRATLSAIHVPTLVLCGRDDTLCPVERHALMHELIPHSIMSIISNAGHLPTIENPVETNQQMAQWLNTELN